MYNNSAKCAETGNPTVLVSQNVFLIYDKRLPNWLLNIISANCDDKVLGLEPDIFLSHRNAELEQKSLPLLSWSLNMGGGMSYAGNHFQLNLGA